MSRFGQVKIFSILFGIIYTALFYFNWAPFRYYPAMEKFTRETLPLEEGGPAILWYAWVIVGVAISAVIALLIPRKLAERLSTGLIWIVPAALLVAILIYEKRWFF